MGVEIEVGATGKSIDTTIENGDPDSRNFPPRKQHHANPRFQNPGSHSDFENIAPANHRVVRWPLRLSISSGVLSVFLANEYGMATNSRNKADGFEIRVIF
jgi:hypothetical protein